MNRFVAFSLLAAVAVAAPAQMRITEWMYNGTDGEFIEFTNVGGSAINMNGWSFDDNSRTAGSFSLSGFGVVAAGKSVILCEPTAATFIASWGLSGVSVIGENTNNLGRTDEINLYDSGNALIDRLTYDDTTGLGPRTNNVSGNIPLSALGTNNANATVLSTLGDSYGSHAGSTGNIANPGVYTPVPEPATLAVLGLGIMASLRRKARK